MEFLNGQSLKSEPNTFTSLDMQGGMLAYVDNIMMCRSNNHARGFYELLLTRCLRCASNNIDATHMWLGSFCGGRRFDQTTRSTKDLQRKPDDHTKEGYNKTNTISCDQSLTLDVERRAPYHEKMNDRRCYLIGRALLGEGSVPCRPGHQ